MLGGLILGREIVSLLDRKLVKWSSASCVSNKKEKKRLNYYSIMHTNHTYYLQPITILVHNDKFHEFSPRGGFFIGNLNDMHG